MSSFPRHHPEDGALLRYVDGELARGRAKRVERHLKTCAPCRGELEELQKTVGDCARYRQVWSKLLPPPPNPWPDIYRGFARVEESLAGESLLMRLWRPFTHAGGYRRWAVASLAALAVAGVVFYQLRQTPSVQAASILQRAVARAETGPRAERRIRIRTRDRQVTRVVGAARVAAPAEPAAAAIEARFAAAHFDWADPLSARSYQTWRDGLDGKKDEVQTVADPQAPGQNCYRIRTIAAAGELAEATLTLRTADLRPVEERLEFRDREWVELTEIAEPATRSDENTVAANVTAPVRPAEPPSRSAAITPGTAPISDELQVLSALHQIGADLGDPVEVTLSQGKVLVSGVGIPAARQKQIHERLDTMAHVAVEFRDPAPVAAPAEPASAKAETAPTPAAPPAAVETRVERQLGSHAEFEKLSSQLMDWNEAAMARAYALRALAQKFPASAESELAAGDRRLLREMAREHAAALAQPVAGIEETLVPILTALGGAAEAPPAANHASWQPAAEDLFRASRRVDVLLSVMLGMAPGDGSTANLPAELRSALRELRADRDDCQRLLQ